MLLSTSRVYLQPQCWFAALVVPFKYQFEYAAGSAASSRVLRPVDWDNRADGKSPRSKSVRTCAYRVLRLPSRDSVVLPEGDLIIFAYVYDK